MLGLIALCVFPSSLAAAESLPRGIVADKPTEGHFVETTAGYLVPYTAKIPGTDVVFEMVPIPGGSFTMGSPADEADRRDDEGPQFKVTVPPMWIGKYEITWAEYKQYMGLYPVFKNFDALRAVAMDNPKSKNTATLLKQLKKFRELRRQVTSLPPEVDAITTPTGLYDASYTFEFGEDPRQPAVTMTPYAARQYTKWISGITGEFHRLPTEAEWEYACRAGTTTRYSFGDDAGKLGDYAWFTDNSDDQPQNVGQKKPNPWGLFDMHGNVAELVLDAYAEAGYPHAAKSKLTSQEAVAWPTEAYPIAVRGGQWDDDVESLRCAARLGTHDEDWKEEDPNYPPSPWWFSNDPARGVGFRIVRLLAAPTAEDKQHAWEYGVEIIQEDVEYRLEEGRGTRGAVNAKLPQAIQEYGVYQEENKD